MLTGKTIGELTYLETPTPDTLIPVELNGGTYHIDFSAITSNSTVEVTYSELVDKITGETLNTGSYYIITDFRTCYDQPDFNTYGNEIVGDNYKQAEVEPIIVFATSSNTISTTAYQPTYPNDRIQYDWTFNQTERTQGVAYGRISERIDEFNNRTDYDHRTILFKRYQYFEIDFNSPYDGTVAVTSTLYTEMSVSGTGTNFTSLSTGQYVGFRYNNDFRVFEITSISGNTSMVITGLTNINTGSGVEMFPAYSQTNTSYYQNNITTAYTEYYTFDYNNFNVNNYIGNYANSFVYDENPFILANNVFKGSTYRNNTFGDMCFNNSFDDDCENNTIGNYFYNNITDDDFDGNLIGNWFFNNKITSNFQYNRIGENFNNNYLVQNSFYRNNIMNYFNYNIISGGDFQNNEIGSQFNNNILRNGQFYKNDIGNGYNGNKIYYNFFGNLIGNGFNYNNIYCEFANNTSGEYFYSNTLGDINDVYSYAFTDNKIGNEFNNNIVFSDFYKNQVGNQFNDNQISGQTTFNFIGGSFQSNTIYNNFNQNDISNEFKGNMMLSSFEGNKTGPFIGGNQFSGGTYSNNIGSFTFDNDFSGIVADNSWGDSFYGNTIGQDFTDNNIGTDFYGNTIGNGFQYNQIGNNFYNNTIGDNFGYGFTTTQGNRIGNNFFYNTIGEYFYNNSIPDNFHDNQIGNYFQWNVINTDISNIDFTTNYGNITGFSYTATGTNATDSTYIALTGTTNGIGVDATFDIEVSGNTVIGVSGNTQGKLYNTGNTITILGTQIGGTDVDDDVVITVTGISETPIYYEHFTKQIFESKGGGKRISYYDENDVLTIESIGSLPVVQTIAATGGYNNNIYICGTTISEGSSMVTDYGFVWSYDNSTPTLFNSNIVSLGSGTTSWSYELTGLVAYVDVYVRAYATNSFGTSYGNVLTAQAAVCFVKGTMVTLGDRTKKLIEDVDYTDELLVWNFDEGCFDIAKPLWISTPKTTSEYNLIKFSDGSELKTLKSHLGHRIFNKEKGMFTYPMTEDTPIGTTTFNENGEEIKLVGKEIVKGQVEYYNIMTERHINIFANTILTSSRFNNIYLISDMKFIKDNRELRTRNEFIELPIEYYEGLRLGEQTQSVKEITEHIKYLINFEKEKQLIPIK